MSVRGGSQTPANRSEHHVCSTHNVDHEEEKIVSK